MRDAEGEAGLGERLGSDMFAPYPSPGLHDSHPTSPNLGAYGDPFSASSQRLPLVANASPFQRAGMYDEYDEGKSVRSDDIDGKSRLTSHRDDSVSNFTESYAPSRNMFQNADKNPLGKETLPGEVMEGETTEDIKETSTRRRWVAFVWILTWWVPNPFLRWFGRMKRMDVRQAWREKLAINIIIWFMCLCAAFVIAVLGNLICPTEHVFTVAELNSHSFANSPNNVYTAIRGEVFDLTNLVAFHQRVVSVVPSKSILQYGGTKADNIFPVQVSVDFLGRDLWEQFV